MKSNGGGETVGEWSLGAPDPEMVVIERLAREAGCEVLYAVVVVPHGPRPVLSPVVDAMHRRVRPEEAYSLPDPGAAAGEYVYVECAPAGVAHCPTCGQTGPRIPESEGTAACHSAGPRILDHHRPGDPGHGRPEAEFLAASSVGQLYMMLHTYGPGTEYATRIEAPQNTPKGTPYEETWNRQVLEHWSTGQWHFVPREVVNAAAADHCPAAAYRGECPGVDPDELMAWRVEQRAAHQPAGLCKLCGKMSAPLFRVERLGLDSICGDCGRAQIAAHPMSKGERRRRRQNRLRRERDQARRDLGLVRTPYGWE